MGEKIVIGPFNQGLRTDREPFVIDNDNFPTLINAYQWRGRIKRKRGTELLGRLERFFNSNSSAYNSGSSTITLDGSGNGNLLTGFSLQSGGDIVPGTVNIANGGTHYTDPSKDGTLSPSGSINYASGDFTILAEAGNAVSATFNYYPKIPVMGLEETNISNTQNTGTLAFDQTYAYNISQNLPYPINDVSWYKNPSTGTYSGYTQKSVWTPTSWNGTDYQQFWTTNYENAFWATNGMKVPFNISNIGMQFKSIMTVTVLTPTTATLTINGHGLVVGDFLFINEVQTTTGINFQTGYVTTVVDVNNVTVTFPNASIATNGSGGIAQYLTSRSDTTKDCIRWYDGDPTNGNPTSPVFVAGNGWVNFMPPLSQQSFSIAGLNQDQYYLVGAKMIVFFKDRLLFIGPIVQTSSGSPTYLQDTIIYSQNGTPFYTCSFTGAVDLPTTEFFPILTPTNPLSNIQNAATANAFFSDQAGFGGFFTFGTNQAINTASTNEDVLILGFDRLQTRLIYSGNDVVPFNAFVINSEYGSTATFSIINMDDGVLTIGSRGFTRAAQTEVFRIDLLILDQIFQFNLNNNGTQRITAQRDFINEWVYFTYVDNEFNTPYNNQTLQYNYRDNSWAIFNETYTTYGPFIRRTGYTWSTIGTLFPTWADWNTPWNAGDTTLQQPEVIGGNQQGFVLFRDVGTGEGDSLYITSFSGSIVTCNNHCLNSGDYIVISGCLGTISSNVNNQIFSVLSLTSNTFSLNPSIGSGTYLGNGYITRMYVPMIQTKQFPTSWGLARKTRIGVQQYLLSTTQLSQITLLIFLSQNASTPYNTGNIVPQIGSVNSSLIYSTVLYTCPESTNLGLTFANSNLQMPTASQQAQIWHRVNTSLIGDTVQLGFTLSDNQMRALAQFPNPFAITGATQASSCVLSTTAQYSTGSLVLIQGVVGMTQLNGNNYFVITSTMTTVTINVDSTLFNPYVSGGTITQVGPLNAFAEIELHGIIMDVNPSQVLA